MILTAAKGDKMRANHEVEAAEEAESQAADTYHRVADRVAKDKGEPGS